MATLCNFTEQDKKDFYDYCKTISHHKVVFRELLFTEKDCPKGGIMWPDCYGGLGSSMTGEQILVPSFTFDSAGKVLSRSNNHLAAHHPPKNAILRECKAAYAPHATCNINKKDDIIYVYVLRYTLAPKEVGIVLFTDRQQFDYKLAIGGMPILSEEEIENEDFKEKIKDRLS